MGFGYSFGFPFGGDSGGGSTPPLPDPSASRALGKAQPIGRDLEFNFNIGDLQLRTGDLALARDIQAIAQEVNIRLSFLLGEWFLDVTAGVPYLQVILVKSPILAAVKTVLTDEILNCAGIGHVTKLDLAFNRSTRVLTVTWAATTNLGALIPDQEVTL